MTEILSGFDMASGLDWDRPCDNGLPLGGSGRDLPRSAHPSVDRDTHSEQAREHAKLAVERAKNPEVDNNLHDKVRQKKGIDVPQGGVAITIILIERLCSRSQQPK